MGRTVNNLSHISDPSWVSNRMLPFGTSGFTEHFCNNSLVVITILQSIKVKKNNSTS